MATFDVEYRTSENPRFNPLARAGELIRRRQIIGTLAGKELKVKYKSTILGVAWSMLNPLLYLLVFYIVFNVLLRGAIPDFAVFLLSGLLGYTLFSTAFQTATTSIVDNAPLVTKVAFPREILPLSAIAAALVNFGYQLAVLLLFMVVIGYGFTGWAVLLVPTALAVLLLFTAAVSMGTSAFNVRYRDTRHLVELSLVAWFWITPIVYAPALVLDRLDGVARMVYLANPLTAVTLAFQRALYGLRLMGPCGGEVAPAAALPGRLASPECTTVLPDAGLGWYFYRLGLVAAASVALLMITWWFFFRRSGDFAEEI